MSKYDTDPLKHVFDEARALVEKEGAKLKRKPGWLKKLTSPTMTVTLGKSIYLSEFMSQMDKETQIALMRHELVHVKHQRWMTPPIFFILYGLLPLPIGLSIFRWLFELAGYLETARAWVELGRPDKVEKVANHFANVLARSTYFWGFPFKSLSKKVFLWRAKKFLR